MIYSKLINIEAQRTKIMYNFSFNKTFSFRFLTPEFPNGIKLNTDNIKIINNSESGETNWYKYTKDIKFSNLNKFRNLVLQIISDEDYGDNDIQVNDTFKILTKNKWYKCPSNDPNCGVILKNVQLNQRKPLQEIDFTLRYEITGDAEIVKKKYIKAGKYDSCITVTGFEPYVINFIPIFKLDSINQNKKTEPINTVNKYTYQPDINDSENSDINNKIEMIKFQIKNYFIENNKEIDTIYEKIEDNENCISNNLIKIDDIFFELSEYDLVFNKIKNDIDTINNNIIDISSNCLIYDDKFVSIFELTDDLIESKDKLNNDLIKLKDKIETLNQEQTDRLDEKIILINNKLDKLTNESNNLENSIISLKNELDYQKNLLENNIIKINDNNEKIVEKFNLISNKLDNYIKASNCKLNELIVFTNKMAKNQNEFQIIMNHKIKENINKTESNEILIDDINKEISKINNSLEKISNNESSMNEVKNEIKKINSSISEQKDLINDILQNKTI